MSRFIVNYHLVNISLDNRFICYIHRALQESLLTSFQASSSSSNSGQNNSEDVTDSIPDYMDPNLELAIKLSQEEERRREEDARREQEMLEQVLRLSLEEK